MAEYLCRQDMADLLEVGEKFDNDNELEIGVINDSDIYAHVFLSKEQVENLVKHLTHLLEESK